MILYSGSQTLLVGGPFSETLKYSWPPLRILSQKSSEDQKKGHHFETVSDFFIFVPKVK